jgi:hypothetical protein
MVWQKKKFEDYPEHIKFIIRQFAAFMTPSQIAKDMKKVPEFPELSISTIGGYRKKYAPAIMEQRKLMRETFPIMNPEARFSYLQDVIEKAQAGSTITYVNGATREVIDFNAIIAAIKVVNDMTGYNKRPVDLKDTDDDGMDAEEQRSIIIRDAFEKYLEKKENKDKAIKDVIQQFSLEMELDAARYINEEDYTAQELVN